MLSVKNLKPGDRVRFKYPVHGEMNVNRLVEGTVDRIGKGIHSRYVTVNEDDGRVRSFSEDRIVAR